MRRGGQFNEGTGRGGKKKKSDLICFREGVLSASSRGGARRENPKIKRRTEERQLHSD